MNQSICHCDVVCFYVICDSWRSGWWSLLDDSWNKNVIILAHIISRVSFDQFACAKWHCASSFLQRIFLLGCIQSPRGIICTYMNDALRRNFASLWATPRRWKPQISWSRFSCRRPSYSGSQPPIPCGKRAIVIWYNSGIFLRRDTGSHP